jgi:hypothetical protein
VARRVCVKQPALPVTAQPGTWQRRLGKMALTSSVTRTENTIPIRPPAPVSVTASLKNCSTISRRREVKEPTHHLRIRPAAIPAAVPTAVLTAAAPRCHAST